MNPNIGNIEYLIPLSSLRVENILKSLDGTKLIKITYAVIESKFICIHGNLSSLSNK